MPILQGLQSELFGAARTRDLLTFNSPARQDHGFTVLQDVLSNDGSVDDAGEQGAEHVAELGGEQRGKRVRPTRFFSVA